jgi:photosystem II stability/assembly factor-like uncharacterized protein
VPRTPARWIAATAAVAATVCVVFVGSAQTRPASPSPSPTATPGPTFVFRSIGPSASGGRLGDVVGSDRDAGLYYIGGAGGGIYKTTNGGFDWTPVFDGAGVAPIGALALSPADPAVVWAGTGESNPRNDVSYGDGVYRSDDAGGTWSHVGLDGTSQIARISIDPRDPHSLLVAALGDPFADSTERGIYRTADNGKSWTQALYLGPSTGCSDIVRDPRNPEIVYAGMWQFRRHAWSISSGGEQDGVFRSADGGKTWTRLEGHGLPTGVMGRIGLAIARSNPKRIYALIQSPQGLLWRSDDAGASWSFVSKDSLINQRPFYFSRVHVDPANADHVFADSVYIIESGDGGKTWKQSGKRLHNDHHAMWIAADGRRILSGGDGGAELSQDGGRTWVRMNYAPLAQAYHVGYDLQDPYHVCASTQDDGTFCGPTSGPRSGGIYARDWLKVAGGDGTWAWPDPLDPQAIWYSNGGEDNGGSLSVFDTRTRQDINASPYVRDQNVVPPRDLRYRFNWESPLSFSPQDGRVLYYGGNVVFETRDRGRRWRVISPDLTRNIKLHQAITGGPITREGTGAETSDTILVIAPSPVRAGLVWVGTDDGVVQVTRDGGAHWKNVTMPGLDEAARVEMIEPSTLDAGTAYANADRHFVGDRAPYLYVTHDYGSSWRRIDAGLPHDQFVRSIRRDPRNPSLLYAGLEQSMWISYDAGGTWQRVGFGLPPASVRDIHVHPRANDLIVATHGRGVFILDDVAPLQQLAAAKSAGIYLFTPRAATAYARHDDSFEVLGKAANPADALVTFYRAAAGAQAPRVEIADATGRVVRHLSAPNATGIVRVEWDLSEDAPTGWLSAPEWNRDYDSGSSVVPGPYTVRLLVDGRTLRAALTVRADPRLTWKRSDYERRHAFLSGLYRMYDAIDVTLNKLDAVRAQARERRATANLAPALGGTIDAFVSRADAVAAAISQNPQNDQDNDYLTDVLRERVEALIGSMDGSSAPPSRAQADEQAALAREYRERMGSAAAFLTDDVAGLNRELIAAGLKAIDPTAAPPAPT